MAYNNYNNNYGNNRGQGNRGGVGGQSNYNGGGNRPYNDRNRNAEDVAVDLSPKALPAAYVDAAEQVIAGLTGHKVKVEKALGQRVNTNGVITSSKLRNLFSILNDINNDEIQNAGDTLLESSIHKLYGFRIRLVYEAGRDDAVKRFIVKAELLRYIKQLEAQKSRAEFIRFVQYMEALVAYHRVIYEDKKGR